MIFSIDQQVQGSKCHLTIEEKRKTKAKTRLGVIG